MQPIRNEHMSYKPILYLDMDGPLVDFDSAVGHCVTEAEKEFLMSQPGFFESLSPTKCAVAAVEWIILHFEPFIATTTPWNTPLASTEKRLWVDKHLPKFYKRIITTHFKNLLIGDFLIDDRSKNGAAQFSGEWIQFGSTEFPNWQVIIDYLARRMNVPSILLSLQ